MGDEGLSPIYKNRKYLYPDRTCRFYIDCDLPETETRFFKCANYQKFDGFGCVPESVYSDYQCGADMQIYDYGMAFEYQNGFNDIASLNYDDTCIGQDPSGADDDFCANQCGCEGAHCKGCQEQLECRNKCKYKTIAGTMHFSKKYHFCKHLKPQYGNDNSLWTDWTCGSYVHCESNEYEVVRCPEDYFFSARDNKCVKERTGKRCGQWFKQQAKDHRNYTPTWSNKMCVFSTGA